MTKVFWCLLIIYLNFPFRLHQLSCDTYRDTVVVVVYVSRLKKYLHLFPWHLMLNLLVLCCWCRSIEFDDDFKHPPLTVRQTPSTSWDFSAWTLVVNLTANGKVYWWNIVAFFDYIKSVLSMCLEASLSSLRKEGWKKVGWQVSMTIDGENFYAH